MLFRKEKEICVFEEKTNFLSYTIILKIFGLHIAMLIYHICFVLQLD